MCPESEKPSGAEPETSDVIDQLRDGIARARVIVREARQAIGQAPREGALLPSGPESDPEPDQDGPAISAT